MGSEISDTRFNTMIMSSLPESYHPTLQTITASKRASILTGGSDSASKKMKPSDLIAFLMEEAQHHIINDKRTKNSEQSLAAHGKKKGKGKSNKRKADDKALNADSEIICHNCKRKGHKKADCWAKGGGKEGQGPRQKKSKKKTKAATVAAVDDNDKELFAFTCTSNFANIAEALQVPKSRLRTCIDSGASQVYSPDCSKFANYKAIDHGITTADGRQLKATGMGDLEIDLPNSSNQPK